ncbi:Ubiquitin conjugation factor E4 B [Lamellibrachia satsuma]|nr:Ubiquitin conjugation factor E4 B [Lamellibrachia satsuma]
MSELTPEEIRRRRLARLAVGSSTPTSSSSQPGPSMAMVSQPMTSPSLDATFMDTGGTSLPQVAMDTQRSAGDTSEHSASQKGEPESMETDVVPSEKTQQSQVDVDSGIDTMEVDDVDQQRAETKRKRLRTPIQCTDDAKQQVLSILGRILQVSFGERQPDRLDLQNLQLNTDNEDLKDLLSEILVEVLILLQQSSENPLKDLRRPVGYSGTSPSKYAANHGNNSLLPSRQFPFDKFQPRQCRETDMINYLLDCYERVSLEERNSPKTASGPGMCELLSEVRGQCVGHATLVLHGRFSQDRIGNRSMSLLLPFLLNDNLPPAFLSELVFRTSDDPDTFKHIFVPVLHGLVLTMRHLSFDTHDYKQPLMVLSQLCDIKVGNTRPLCNLIVRQSNWLPEPVTQAIGMELEKLSFLGPFFGLSVFAEDNTKVVEKFFSNPQMSTANARLINDTLQQSMQFTREELFKIMHTILVNSETRDAAMSYLMAGVQRNHKRSQIQMDERLTDERLVCGDGFMLNFLSVLQRLSVKIKLDKVDPYYPNHPRCCLSIKDDSRLHSTSNQVTEWINQLNNAPGHQWEAPKFPTECYFLTLHCHHLSILPIIRKYQRQLRAVRDLQRIIEEMQALEPQWRDSPVALRNQELLKRWKSQVKRLQKAKIVRGLGPGGRVSATAVFSSTTPRPPSFWSNWLSLPLAQEVPMVFATLPDYYLEDIAEFILFCIQYQPGILADPSIEDFVTLLIVFICTAHYINNPYLVAKLVEVVYILNPGVQRNTQQVNSMLLNHPLALGHLEPALMKFYTDIETTGSSSEFYDKFTIRYHISIIFRTLWEIPVHQAKIIQEANSGQQFVKFVNMLMNDTTFLLDESMDTLKSIRELQELQENKAEWDKLSQGLPALNSVTFPSVQ